jgi:hypothetical protein
MMGARCVYSVPTTPFYSLEPVRRRRLLRVFDVLGRDSQWMDVCYLPDLKLDLSRGGTGRESQGTAPIGQ